MSGDGGRRPKFTDTCDHETVCGGECVPCEKPAVGVRVDVDGHTYAVCSYHARGEMVPLSELLAGEA